LEDAGEVERRLREAARVIDLERLAISPQCGFATSVVGNALTEAEQAAKLRLLCAVRDRVWG
jgi:5-methyltetrahydropteroyltriglutamate--homocysteine methyltransferase